MQIDVPYAYILAMIWIDRLALVWAALLWGGMALLANGHGHAEDALSVEVIKAVMLLAGAPWLLLHGLRWAFVGHKPPKVVLLLIGYYWPWGTIRYILFGGPPPRWL